MAAAAALLERGFRVLQPLGEDVTYDLVVEVDGRFLRVLVKNAWYNARSQSHVVDTRRIKAKAHSARYSPDDFDFALVYLQDKHVFYVMPVSAYLGYGSIVTFVESEKRQKKPQSAVYRESWEMLTKWLPIADALKDKPFLVDGAFNFTVPSPTAQDSSDFFEKEGTTKWQILYSMN